MLSITLPTRDERGFTLIELLVVIIIIGILAAVAIPLFLDQRKLAVDASVKSDVRNTATAFGQAVLQDPTTDPSTFSPFVSKGLGSAEHVAVAADPNNAGQYIVSGYDDNGEVLTSAASAYVFTSATGQFTIGSAAGSGTGSSTPSSTPTASSSPLPSTTPSPTPSTGTGDTPNESTAYYGSSDSFGFKRVQVNNDQTQLFFDSGSQYFDSSTPEYYPNAYPITSDIPLINGADGTTTDQYGNANSYNVNYGNYGTSIDSVALSDKDGNALSGLTIDPTSCYMTVAAHDGVYFQPSGDPDNPNNNANPDYAVKGALNVSGACNLSRKLTETETASLKGGALIFSVNGQTSTIPLNGTVSYQGIPADASNDPGNYTGTYSDSAFQATFIAHNTGNANYDTSDSIQVGTNNYATNGSAFNNPDLPVLSQVDTSTSGYTSFNVSDVKIFNADGTQIYADGNLTDAGYGNGIQYQKADSTHYKDTVNLNLNISADPESTGNLSGDIAGGHVEFTVNGQVNTLHISANNPAINNN